MRAMKNSGIEWIGEIPEDWTLSKIGAVYEQRNTKVSDKDFQPLSVTKNGVVLQLDNAAKTNDGDNRKLIRKNDFVINSRSDRRGSCGISEYDGSCSLINTVLAPKGSMVNNYYNYVFRSERFADEFYRWGSGIVDDLWSTKWSSMKKIYIPVPTLEEQKSIATYLDNKSLKLDSIINEEQKVITKLQEYRLSLITEKVTKGLNPNVEMKDSGIKWIGDIPKHWKVVKLKYTARMKGRIGWQGLKASEFRDEGAYLITGTDFVNGRIDFNRSYHVSMERYDEAPEIQVKIGDLLITKDGTIGKLAYIDRLPGVASLNSHLLLIRPINEAFSNRFLFWLLSSGVFQKHVVDSQNGSIMASITQEKMSNFSAYFPTMQEQELIANYLDTKCAYIDAVITKKQALVEKFTEYKKSLIYEVVTGKKEV